MAVKQAALLGGAAACLALAAVLVVGAGLPERALFTGRILPGERPIAPEIDAIAPPFEAQTLDGSTINLFNLRGAPVVINFWATWCEPCRVEMPDLQAFYEAHHEEGLRLIAVNLGETPDAARAWTDEMGLTFDVALDPNGNIASAYLLRGQPSTYVVSPGGVITQIFFGPTTRDALEQSLAPFLTTSHPNAHLLESITS
jgi:peroxiredoxin